MKNLYVDNERRLLKALRATLGDRLSDGQIDWIATIYQTRRYRSPNPADYDRRLGRYLRRVEDLVSRKARSRDEHRSQIAALEDIAHIVTAPTPARRKATTASSSPAADLRIVPGSRDIGGRPSRFERQDSFAR
jgi:hypothetical protein